MANWGAVAISSGAVVVVDAGTVVPAPRKEPSSGLCQQRPRPDCRPALPGKSRVVEFNNMQTSGVSILVHTIIYFGLITILLIAVGVHIYTG
ncbi:hypothetical protein F0562_004496 [Nyssa sinensis]|uniref:Uncharacterized protein n=1 Tax=Nyssa sinensis TaxID=561372 RepID=A0A5J5BYH5_9ASTE|nr:hypothetical protein F0562_004496 [Nyssa sinensis]